MAEHKTAAQKAEEAAHDADVKATEARLKAESDARTPEQKKIDDAAQKADDARAKAEQTKADEAAVGDATLASDPAAKGLVALASPDIPIGDHLAQRFSHTPENPQIAPGVDGEPTVRLTLETSDTKAAGKPMVAYVHPEMVGDYLRAGWSR